MLLFSSLAQLWWEGRDGSGREFELNPLSSLFYRMSLWSSAGRPHRALRSFKTHLAIVTGTFHITEETQKLQI